MKREGVRSNPMHRRQKSVQATRVDSIIAHYANRFNSPPRVRFNLGAHHHLPNEFSSGGLRPPVCLRRQFTSPQGNVRRNASSPRF